MLANRISRLTVRNYRSLADVTVDLEDLTVLVGPNGSGKSNFIDALRFVRDALHLGLDRALMDRGGINSLQRYSPSGQPYDIEITINTTFEDQGDGLFSLTIRGDEQNNFRLQKEICHIGPDYYEIINGIITSSNKLVGVGVPDQLSLIFIGSTRAFRPMRDFLTSFGFYAIFPDKLRSLQVKGNLTPLSDSGENLATVLRQFISRPANVFQEGFYENFARIVPGIITSNPISIGELGSYLAVYLQHENGAKFDLAQESDGTLRVLGLLTAIYQTPSLPLIAFEEPGLIVYPGAIGVLCDLLKEASTRGQITLTTHSPDLISSVPLESLRIVEMVDGVTEIGLLHEDQRQIIHDKLFSSGDLLRMEGLKRG